MPPADDASESDGARKPGSWFARLSSKKETTAADEEEQANKVQELVRDALALYRRRGYAGTIEISNQARLRRTVFSAIVMHATLPPAHRS